MKISHSASPRNRSSRNSRSPPVGNVIAGAVAAGPGPRAITSASAASGGPAIRSAMDVIWHPVWAGRLYVFCATADIVSARELQASYLGGLVRAFGRDY